MEAGQRRGGGAGAAEVEAEGATGGAGGTHVLSCASACLCLGGMQSHMKEAFFFSPPHLSETRIWCPSQKRHCPPPDTLPVSRLNPQLRKHTQQHVRVKTHRCSGRHVGLRTHTQTHAHTCRCALCTQPTGVGFHSNRSSDLKSNKTHQIPLSLDCLITVISSINGDVVTSNHRVGWLTS